LLGSPSSKEGQFDKIRWQTSCYYRTSTEENGQNVCNWRNWSSFQY